MNVIRTLSTNDNSTVISLSFSPDGAKLVSGESVEFLYRGDGKLIKVWDIATGTMLLAFGDTSSGIVSVAYSPHGDRIVSGNRDGTVKVWDASTGELLVSLLGNSLDEQLAITEEGFFNAAGKGPALVGIVRGLEAYSVDQFYQQLYRPDIVRQKLSLDDDIKARVKEAASKVNLDTILASKAPPNISIISPKSESEFSDNSVTVEAKLTEQGGGIGRIEWRVNGVTRGVQDLAHAPTKVGDEANLTRVFPLGDGTSQIEMIAYNKANLAASLPIAVSVTVNSSTPPPIPRLHVLTVGINKYRNSNLNLNYSVADAKSVAAAFQLGSSSIGYESVEIYGPLMDEQVTAQNLQRELERIGKIIRPSDVFVLYLAGHGLTEDGRYYYEPYNVEGNRIDTVVPSSISQDMLQEWLTQINALRSVLIYDTCEAGSNTEDRFRPIRQLVAAEKLSRAMGRTVLSASSDVAAAGEGYPPDARQKHGIFTYVLLDAFARANASKDGKISTAAIADYIQMQLPPLSEQAFKFRQEPQVKLSGAPFPLINRAAMADIDRVR